jgi:hypothetical protein
MLQFVAYKIDSMNALADASSLIVLARQDALWLLERAFGVVALVDGVYNETVVLCNHSGPADSGIHRPTSVFLGMRSSSSAHRPSNAHR